jgi:hypothetical protein
VDGSHNDLQFVSPRSTLFKRLVSFFRDSVKDGVAVVNEVYERLEIDLDFSDTYSRVTKPTERPDESVGKYTRLS